MDGGKCGGSRELISAAADGELSATDQLLLDAHLANCSDCAAYADRVVSLTRSIRLRPAETMPDLVEIVMQRARPYRLGRGGWLRPALVWVAIVIVAQSISPLISGRAEGVSTHLARHLGAFSLAFAIGLLYAAWKPHRAYGMLPFAAALVATSAISAVLDLAAGHRSAVGEVAHFSELAGLLLLWMIAGSPGLHRPRRLALRR